MSRLFSYILTLVALLFIATLPLSAQDKKTEEQRKRTEQYKRELQKLTAEVENLKKEKKLIILTAIN